MSINRHPARLAFTTQIVCIAWLSLACPAYPAGKSPDDCKLENCQEWDEYLHDCVPIDPGPKPDGCYRKNSKCEWEEYTPDCKWFEEKYDRLTLHMNTMMRRALYFKALLNGDLSDEKRKRYQRAYDSCMASADVANRNRDEVKVDWDNCLHCR